MAWTNVWEPRGVCTRFSGVVSAAEYVRSAEDICAARRFDTLRFVIKDLTAIAGHTIDPHARDPIAAIRYGARFTNPDIYLVLLTTDETLLSYAFPKPGSMLRGLYETRAFANETAARGWLQAQGELRRTGAELQP